MAALWVVEAQARGLDPDQRRHIRLQSSAPIVADLFARWRDDLSRIPGKSRLAEAMRYALVRRDTFERFLYDGRIEIDSNTVERAIRPQTLTRKNALFAGSDGGGVTWAAIATLLATARLNDAVHQALGRKPVEVSADTGFASEANLKAMAERRIKAYVPPRRGRGGRDEPDLTARRLKQQPRMLAMAAALKRAGHRSRYRLRKQVVEPVFGQIKQARGFRQFHLRGLHKVRGEWAMLCIAHNLLKLAAAR